jgi:hypothetical protein
MMSLGEFLKRRQQNAALEVDVRATLARWGAAVEHLCGWIKSTLKPYRELEIEEWNMVLEEEGIRYNVPALTILFLGEQITVEAQGFFLIGARGRVDVSCGARLFHLLWNGENDWTYRRVSPHGNGLPQPLTPESLEQIIQELLS